MGKLADLFKNILSTDKEEIIESNIESKLQNDIEEIPEEDPIKEDEIKSFKSQYQKINPLYQQLEDLKNNVIWEENYIFLKSELENVLDKDNIGIADFEKLSKDFEEQINQFKNDLNNYEEDKKNYEAANNAIAFIENIILEINNFLSKESEIKEVTHDNFQKSDLVIKFFAIENILKKMDDNKEDLSISRNSQILFNEFSETYKSFKEKVDVVINKIDELKKDEENIKLEIIEFTNVVKKFQNGLNANNANQQKQLEAIHINLTEKRNKLIKDENELNEYIKIIFKSTNVMVLNFKEIIKKVNNELKIYLTSIKDKLKDVLNFDISSNYVNKINSSISNLNEILNEITRMAEINKKFGY